MAAHNGKLEIIGIPFGKGQPRKGVEHGPEWIRNAGLKSSLTDQGYDVTDHGDVEVKDVPNDPPQCNVNSPLTIGGDMKRVSDKVHHVTKTNPGSLCLNLGGDHTVAIGTIHGHLRTEPNAVVVWVDAHADINPPPASDSGNIHGMPLAFLVHEVQPYMPSVPGFEWIKPCLRAKDLVYIGIRDLDPAEKKLIKDLGIVHFDMYEVDRLGIQQVMAGALQAVNPKLDRPIHLSFDIDGLDPVHAPSTGTPVPGGLTLREGIHIVETLNNTGKLTNFDLVEVNPKLPKIETKVTPGKLNGELMECLDALKQEECAKVTVKTACDLITLGLGGRAVHNLSDHYAIPQPQGAEE